MMPKLSTDLLAEMLKLPPPWLIASFDLDPMGKHLSIEIKWPESTAVPCPKCQQLCGLRDHTHQRQWRHTDAMGHTTTLKCCIPRTECEDHGVLVAAVPWADKLSRMTQEFEAHCIRVLQDSATQESAGRQLGLSFAELSRIVRRAVERGMQRRDLSGMKQLGIDDKAFGKGQNYGTVLSDIRQGRVLEVEKGGTKEAAKEAIQSLPEEVREGVEAIAMDMSEAYRRAAQEELPQAAIVHDRYHIKADLNKAVDKVRRQEHKQLSEQGNSILSGTKYIFLKNPENLTELEAEEFKELAKMELKVGRAWILKELFGKLYSYHSEAWAEKFFGQWFYRATHSRLEPIIKVAWTIKRHLADVISYVKHGITNAVAEGLNSKIQVIKSAARGFRNFANYRAAILFHCGKLDMLP